MADAKFKLDDYVTVQQRIFDFYEGHPAGRILTELVKEEGEHVTFKAFVYRFSDDPRPSATGHAQEMRGDGFINRSSHLENCETSAIGRALANLGYATKAEDRPSREEMEKVAATPKTDTKQLVGSAILAACGGDVPAAQELLWKLTCKPDKRKGRAGMIRDGYRNTRDVPSLVWDVLYDAIADKSGAELVALADSRVEDFKKMTEGAE